MKRDSQSGQRRLQLGHAGEGGQRHEPAVSSMMAAAEPLPGRAGAADAPALKIAKATRRKYRNKPKIDGGKFFASQAEHKRYGELRLLDGAVNGITALRCQPRFPLVVNGKTICTYIADFYYREKGREICEDVKGMETPVFKIKRKLFEVLHPTIELRLIYSGRRSSRMSAAQLRAIEERRAAGLSSTSRGC
jgi:Protein of unknown function (DUF1064)